MTHPGYTFELGCPACGGPLDHVAGSAPTNTRTAAVIHCPGCGIDGLVTVTVSMAYNRRDDTGISGTRPTSDARRAKDRERKRNQRARQAVTA